jgi:hypothetical protein
MICLLILIRHVRFLQMIPLYFAPCLITDTDHAILQHDLDIMSQWCDDNRMTLNASKTKVMRFSGRKAPGLPCYEINSIALEVVDEIKYLGIMLNSSLDWTSHVKYITSRANRMLGFISSMSRGLSTTALLCLYKSLVLPILEYGLPVWNTSTKKMEIELERVQRRATRIILRQRRMEMEYSDRLTSLNWSTLASRRKYLLLSFVAKALCKTVRSEVVCRKVTINHRHTDDVKFSHLSARTNRLHFSSLHMFPRLWDELPQNLRINLVLLSLYSWIFNLKKHVFSF